MNEELEVLKQYVESLGLHDKTGITNEDWLSLIDDLTQGSETGLARYVKNLGGPEELEDLIVNTLYD